MDSTQNRLNIATVKLQKSIQTHVNSVSSNDIKLKECQAEVKMLQDENQQLKVSILSSNVYMWL